MIRLLVTLAFTACGVAVLSLNDVHWTNLDGGLGTPSVSAAREQRPAAPVQGPILTLRVEDQAVEPAHDWRTNSNSKPVVAENDPVPAPEPAAPKSVIAAPAVPKSAAVAIAPAAVPLPEPAIQAAATPEPVEPQVGEAVVGGFETVVTRAPTVVPLVREKGFPLPRRAARARIRAIAGNRAGSGGDASQASDGSGIVELTSATDEDAPPVDDYVRAGPSDPNAPWNPDIKRSIAAAKRDWASQQAARDRAVQGVRNAATAAGRRIAKPWNKTTRFGLGARKRAPKVRRRPAVQKRWKPRRRKHRINPFVDRG